MGRRARRTNWRPKFAVDVAIFVAFAAGALYLGARFIPVTRSSDVAHYSAMRGHHGPVSSGKHAPGHGASAKPSSTAQSSPSTAPSLSPEQSAPPTPANPPGSVPSTPAWSPITSVSPGNVSCHYRQDTWSGNASSVGYSAGEIRATNGDLSSYSVVLNAHPGTTEVVGYPSEQCVTYSALSSKLASSFDITPPANSSGLDYEYAYDIWLTTAAAATAGNWSNDLELMIWTYVNGQVPSGSVAATLSDGSKVWVSGSDTTGTVSVVLPRNETTGTINIASIISQLTALGYVSAADTGILDVEFGIEAPYGGGQTFAVNGFSMTAG